MFDKSLFVLCIYYKETMVRKARRGGGGIFSRGGQGEGPGNGAGSGRVRKSILEDGPK